MKRLSYFVLLTTLALGPAAAQSSGVKPLSPEELQTLEKKGKIYFLDVREPQEIETLGTMKGYVNIPLSQLEKRMGEVPKNALIVTA
jgi:rhodanese-related sulfurtransferase